MEVTFGGRPAAECLAILTPLLDGGALDKESDSLLPTVATITLLVNEDLDRARAAGEAVVAAGLERGWISAVAHGRFLRSLALLPAGAVREAEADARAAYEFKLATVTPLPATLWALHPLVEALIEGDRADEADAALHAAGLGDPPPHALTAPLILQSRARLRLAQGRAADALTDLRDAAARWEELSVRHPGIAAWRADAVGALLSLGERAEAERLATEHLAAAERAGVAGPLCAALRASALVAPREDRIKLLERAVRVAGGLSTRTPSTTSAAPSAAPTDGPRRASRSARPSTSPTPAGRPGSPGWRWRSCTRPAPAHAGPRCAGWRRSPRPKSRSPRWPRTVVPTGRSRSGWR